MGLTEHEQLKDSQTAQGMLLPMRLLAEAQLAAAW
jgi:hypothetical protein